MLCKIITLAVVFGVAIAEPVAKLSTGIPNDLEMSPFRDSDFKDTELISAKADLQPVLRLIPEGVSSVLDMVNLLAGYKFTAVSLAVVVIEWFISNALVIVIGAAAALGLCKITGKCNFNYEEYIPMGQIKEYITPEYLQTAENFFINAVHKYAEKKSKTVDTPKPWFY